MLTSSTDCCFHMTPNQCGHRDHCGGATNFVALKASKQRIGNDFALAGVFGNRSITGRVTGCQPLGWGLDHGSGRGIIGVSAADRFHVRPHLGNSTANSTETCWSSATRSAGGPVGVSSQGGTVSRYFGEVLKVVGTRRSTAAKSAGCHANLLIIPGVRAG